MEAPIAVQATEPALAHAEMLESAGTRLTGRRLVFARALWGVVAALTVAVFVGGVAASLIQVTTVCLTPICHEAHIDPVLSRALAGAGYSYGSFVIFYVITSLIFGIAYGSIALLVFWHRSDDGMALLTSLSLLTFGLVSFTPMGVALASSVPATQPLVLFLTSIGSIGFFAFLFLFPTGRFAPRWLIWVALACAVEQMFHIFFAGSAADTSLWPLAIQIVIWAAFLVSIIYSQVYRYRRISNQVQRLQTKWVVYGIAISVGSYIAVQAVLVALIRDLATLTPDGLRAALLGSAIISVTMTAIPLSIGIAMLRYRLFDVDVLINRTLVHGALTLCVIVLYVLVVGGAGVLFQVRGNAVVALLATGVVAVTVQPLRQRLQRAVNRLIYGQRDEPYTVLSQLGQRLEMALTPEPVLPAIVETVVTALKLPYAAIALKQEDAFVRVASYGTLAGEPLVLPLVYQTEKVGELILGARIPDGGWARADLRLLEGLAHQTAVAAHAVNLNAELKRARERLVLAREEERRRLRRDLHDGLGPQLASQTLTLTAATKLLRNDPGAAEALLAEATAHAQAAITDIRRVVYELRPAALDDLGLVGALHEQAARYHASGVLMTIEAPETPPLLPAAVEVACYRIAQEAMTNVVRHAGARHCTVSLTFADSLRLEVRDDGKGIPAQRGEGAGVGLTSMRERAEELGGTCVVTPTLEGGTRVFARLPLS
jgi:signal transduction histidine kinase